MASDGLTYSLRRRNCFLEQACLAAVAAVAAVAALDILVAAQRNTRDFRRRGAPRRSLMGF